MKFTLDLPSLGAGIFVGLLFAGASSAPWLLNYSNVSMPSVVIAYCMLAACGLLLVQPLGLMRRMGLVDPTAAGSELPRVETARPSGLPWTDLDTSAMRPIDWLPTASDSAVSWRELVHSRFVVQLSTRGLEDMTRAILLAVRAARGSGTPGKQEIGKLAAFAWGGLTRGVAPDFSGFCADLLVRRPDLDGVSLRDELHFFPTTRILAEIDAVRREGWILPSADFRWAKAFDRALFYAISNLGRSSMFVEGAGISAHYAAERKAGQAITTPAVETALEAIEFYLRAYGLADVMGSEA